MKPDPITKQTREVAESVIFKRTRPNARRTPCAHRWRFRSGVALDLHKVTVFQNVPRETTSRTTPSTFLLVVTPVFISIPSGEYPRPRSGKYLIKSKESGN